jgi:hypothetical protein
MGAKTRDVGSEIAFLTRPLKGPTIRQAAPRLAERARSESCPARPSDLVPGWRRGRTTEPLLQPRDRAIEVAPVDPGEDTSDERRHRAVQLDDPFEPGRRRTRRFKPMVIGDAHPRQPADPFPALGRFSCRHPKDVAPKPPDPERPLDLGPSSPGGATSTETMCGAHSGHRSTSARRCQASSSGALTSNSAERLVSTWILTSRRLAPTVSTSVDLKGSQNLDQCPDRGSASSRGALRFLPFPSSLCAPNRTGWPSS